MSSEELKIGSGQESTVQLCSEVSHTKYSGPSPVLPMLFTTALPNPSVALRTHLESNLGVMPGVGFTRDGSSLLIAGVTKSWLNLQVRYSYEGCQVTGATEANGHIRWCPEPITLCSL